MLGCSLCVITIDTGWCCFGESLEGLFRRHPLGRSDEGVKAWDHHSTELAIWLRKHLNKAKDEMLYICESWTLYIDVRADAEYALL
ncbi:hypothetical protein PoB_000363300 [Plakobranchus ocellatus]|uniref:Uncharacterized protein n=1 Tax=Plakobranchus ocellatus TaxID=259542 RepID=A0AAV3Y472_9GAST|nr:hypothetical protein PoB_000363300 [Plakobranchus ocellatus]